MHILESGNDMYNARHPRLICMLCTLTHATQVSNTTPKMVENSYILRPLGSIASSRR